MLTKIIFLNFILIELGLFLGNDKPSAAWHHVRVPSEQQEHDRRGHDE